MKWISVKDRLPDHEDFVIIAYITNYGKKKVTLDYCSTDSFGRKKWNWYDDNNTRVLFWQELPAFPRGQLNI